MNRQLYDPRDWARLPEAIEAELKPDSPALCAACNRWGTLLAVGCKNGDVAIYDMMTRGQAGLLSASQIPTEAGAVADVVWTRKGRHIIAGYSSGTVCQWDVAAARVDAARDFGAEVTAVSIAEGNANAVLVAFARGEPHLWSPASGEAAAVPFPADGRIYATLDRRGRFAVLASDRGLIAMYDVAGERVLDALQMPAAKGMSLNHQGDMLLLPGTSCIRAATVSAPNKQHAAAGLPPQEAFDKLAEAKPGTALLAGSALGALLAADAAEFREALDNVKWRCASVSRDGEVVMGGAVLKDRHVIYLWERVSGRLLRVLEGPQVGLQSCLWHPSPYRSMLLTVTVAGGLFIWAYIIAENWDVFAPGFRSLSHNKEHVESETEFDLNPKDDGEARATSPPPAEIDITQVPPNEACLFASDTETDAQEGMHMLPVRLTALAASPGVPRASGTEGAADSGAGPDSMCGEEEGGAAAAKRRKL